MARRTRFALAARGLRRVAEYGPIKRSVSWGLASATPLIAALMARWRWWRRPRYKVQKPYFNLRARWRLAAKIIFPLLALPAGLIYGFYFALTAPYLIVPFAIPAVILLALSIWALPSSGTPPLRTMEFFFYSTFVGLILWPNYLALALPGLPWITVIRLTGFPMAALLLVSISMSHDVRLEIWRTVTVIPPLWTAFIIFLVTQIVTLPFSHSASESISRVLIHSVNWIGVFIASAYIFQKPGRPQFCINLLLALAGPVILIAILETMQRSSLWLNTVPNFLKVDDPMVKNMLGNVVRSATGQYRAKATFSTPLGLAEFMALLMPFAMHMAIGRNRTPIRIIGVLLVPLLFYVVRLTDGRLGTVGILVSFLMYLLLWGLMRFRRKRGDIVSSTLVYAYPAVFALSVMAVVTIQPLNEAVFGGGAQSASDLARQNQRKMGFPKIVQQPIGHGAGNSGSSMGYGEGQFVAVDNYYLTTGLDYGVVGTVSFVMMFAIAILYGARYAILAAKDDDPEIMLLIPLAVTFSAFLVVKWVFSQEDNHPLLFMMLGMTVALVDRTRRNIAAAAAEGTTKKVEQLETPREPGRPRHILRPSGVVALKVD